MKPSVFPAIVRFPATVGSSIVGYPAIAIYLAIVRSLVIVECPDIFEYSTIVGSLAVVKYPSIVGWPLIVSSLVTV